MGELPNPLDVEEADRTLHSYWQKVISGPKEDVLEDEVLIEAIKKIIRGKVISYRYALPTQILAKVIDASLNCHCLQVKRGGAGAFDARSFCKKVIVPFNRQHGNVLGTADDPYVSKPLRHEELSALYRDQIKDKEGWDTLCLLSDEIETKNDPSFTATVLEQVLVEIYRRLSGLAISYPIPHRASLDKVQRLITEYVAEPSGGVRPEIIAYSLLSAVGSKFKLFKCISSSKTTAANRMMGRVSDLECYDKEERIRLAVSVKDIVLTKGMVEEQINKIHESGVRNLLFLAFKGIKGDERKHITQIITREFDREYNVHIVEKPEVEVVKALLIFLEEEGQKDFLKRVGNALDEYASYEDRRRWAELLARL